MGRARAEYNDKGQLSGWTVYKDNEPRPQEWDETQADLDQLARIAEHLADHHPEVSGMEVDEAVLYLLRGQKEPTEPPEAIRVTEGVAAPEPTQPRAATPPPPSEDHRALLIRLTKLQARVQSHTRKGQTNASNGELFQWMSDLTGFILDFAEVVEPELGDNPGVEAITAAVRRFIHQVNRNQSEAHQAFQSQVQAQRNLGPTNLQAIMKANQDLINRMTEDAKDINERLTQADPTPKPGK